MQPDYSRQVLLKEIGPAGQAALARGRILIVGAGGLGSPVLQYLAGAGVGHLTVLDADRLDASNLHRQPLYSLADVGRRKVDLAREAVGRINPTVHVDAQCLRLDAGNAGSLIGAHDAVIDCSDNFRTKFLINDAAVLARRPAIFASVYQYEGHLQVYKPEPSHACLRCLWPDTVADGVVGNCAEAGVLGPVPGTFGTLQALLAIKILTGLPGQLDGELLMFDFNNFSTLKLKAPRRAECRAPACALVHAIAPEDADIEVTFQSVASAQSEGLEVIDIRSAEEFAGRPTAARHIPMDDLLADPRALPASGALLLCASGKRSLAAARQLRQRGFAVRSIAGGLNAMEH